MLRLGQARGLSAAARIVRMNLKIDQMKQKIWLKCVLLRLGLGYDSFWAKQCG